MVVTSYDYLRMHPDGRIMHIPHTKLTPDCLRDLPLDQVVADYPGCVRVGVIMLKSDPFTTDWLSLLRRPHSVLVA